MFSEMLDSFWKGKIDVSIFGRVYLMSLMYKSWTSSVCIALSAGIVICADLSISYATTTLINSVSQCNTCAIGESEFGEIISEIRTEFWHVTGYQLMGYDIGAYRMIRTVDTAILVYIRLDSMSVSGRSLLVTLIYNITIQSHEVSHSQDLSFSHMYTQLEYTSRRALYLCILVLAMRFFLPCFSQ